ncbi:MAG: ATP synthase F1 subunit gamma [Candidatus Eremiobacteraeota bacterium]|nr:ATP synthase F1 subunit gamma [Candidatus Eremiobacteraeota bacterium]MCW5868488.1 ATP synthase F1 subunit gamma [Candidatus Eremiobacteraeota bacterium]
MASERDLKRRIKAVKNTEQITKAMKMVAAARIKKAEDVLKAARPYSKLLKEVVQDLTAGMDEVVHPLMTVRPVARTAYLVVTSDKGLCGSYNNNLLKLVWSTFGTVPKESYKLISVGGKGDKFFRRRKMEIDKAVTGWTPTFALAQELANLVTDWFLDGQVDEVKLVYSQSISAITQKPVVERILPMSPEKVDEPKGAGGGFAFEPSADAALNILLPRYVQNIIYRVLAESRVSELGARLKSMSAATDNANKLAGELTLQFYRIRQDNITKEILEIVGGAEALRASK